MIFKMVGLQRSGTNWVKRLMLQNFQCGVDDVGKHKLPTEAPDETVLLIRKGLDNWLWSIGRYHADLSESLFPGGELDRVGAGDLHARFNKAWLDVGAVLVRYETVLEDVGGWLAGIENRFNLDRKHEGPWETVQEGFAWSNDKRQRYLEHAE